jgi:hypothetical protein
MSLTCLIYDSNYVLDMNKTTESAMKPFAIATGLWPRFSKYEIHDGHIRPAKRTTLRVYDPWEDYRLARESGEPAPYDSLLKVISGLTLSVRSGGTGVALTPESEAAVLEWCSEHGLLGVLLAQIERVVLPARWRGDLPNGMVGVASAYPFPAQVRYVRTNVGWEARNFIDMGGMDRLMHGVPRDRRPTTLPGEGGKLVPEEWLPFFPKLEKPKVWLRDLVRGELTEKNLDETWARYFPSVAPDDYPKPALVEVDDEQVFRAFWEHYAEPVEDFVRTASALRDALEGLRHAAPVREMTPEQIGNVSRGISALHALIFPVRSAVGVLEDGTFREQWISPSLLTSLAKMAHEDVTGGRRPLSCALCGRTFVSDAYQARYCSPRCRNTAQKREYRRKVHEKEAVASVKTKPPSRTRQQREKAAPVSNRMERRARPPARTRKGRSLRR